MGDFILIITGYSKWQGIGVFQILTGAHNVGCTTWYKRQRRPQAAFSIKQDVLPGLSGQKREQATQYSDNNLNYNKKKVYGQRGYCLENADEIATG